MYRLHYPQPLGLMTLFSMASLQHGARRRRQGFRSPVLVEEARALQVALFQVIQNHAGQMDLSQLPATLMAIADEVNAQLLQSLSGYENEKPVEFPASCGKRFSPDLFDASRSLVESNEDGWLRRHFRWMS